MTEHVEQKPRFMLELSLSRLAAHVYVEDPALISDRWLDQAWNMMNAFVMDMLDELEPDCTDERFREALVEVCYKLAYREMSALKWGPSQEQAFQENIKTGKRGARVRKKSPYDDSLDD